MGYTPSGLAGNSPQNVSLARTNYNFLGALEAANFAAIKPDVNPELTRRYGMQDDLITMFEKIGFKRRISGNTIFRHYEEERLHAPIVLDTTTGGQGNGVTVTVNIASSDVFDIDQEAPYIGSSSTSAVVPKIGDVGYFSNNVECLVTDVDASAGTFDATPTQADEEVPNITAGDEFIILSRANEEGSEQGESTSGRVIYYQNNVQILRSDYKITNTALGEEMWINFQGKYGAGPHWYYYDMDRFYKRHKQYVANSMLFGKEITNTALANIAGFSTTKKTKGLIPTIEDSGITESYVADSMDLDDLGNVIESLKEQMSPNQYAILCDNTWRRDFNKLIREGDGADFIQDDRASILFAQFNGGVQKVDFDVDAFKFLGYQLNIKEQNAFNDPTQLKGIDKYNGFAVGIPVGEVNIREELNAGTTSVPTLNVVYKADGMGGDREHDEYVLTPAQTGRDTMEHFIITEGGVETNAINHFFQMTNDASA
jgi:hypothetical protein